MYQLIGCQERRVESIRQTLVGVAAFLIDAQLFFAHTTGLTAHQQDMPEPFQFSNTDWLVHFAIVEDNETKAIKLVPAWTRADGSYRELHTISDETEKRLVEAVHHWYHNGVRSQSGVHGQVDIDDCGQAVL